jgi:peptidoglycan/xylan/chitin deacetylase (PgdA/CDA1 family)
VLLDGLEQRGVPATFFLCGYRIEEYPELTRRILQEGHEIGLHGYSHKNMQKMSRKDVELELERTIALLPEGCSPTFLRPPGGQSSRQVLSVAEKMGLSVLLWSVDPQDWATDNVQAIETNVLCRVRDGDVILLHDMSDSSVEAALRIVDILSKRGFRFVTVTELAQIKGHTLKPGKEYYRFS